MASKDARLNAMDRKLITLGLVVGSVLGSYAPVLWGGDVFSFSSIFFSATGALIGIWVGFRMGR
jgi:hypothetical protein